MANRRITEDGIISIAKEFLDNATIKDLALKYGVSTVTVRKYLYDQGIVTSPGQPTLRHRLRPPIKTLNLEPAYSYLRELGDPSKTRVMHELVETHGVGYKWSSREMLRRRIDEWMDTAEGRFARMARLIAIELAGNNDPDDAARKNAINNLDRWLKNYSASIPFNIMNAAEALDLEADIMAIKRWLLAKDT